MNRDIFKKKFIKQLRENIDNSDDNINVVKIFHGHEHYDLLEDSVALDEIGDCKEVFLGNVSVEEKIDKVLEAIYWFYERLKAIDIWLIYFYSYCGSGENTSEDPIDYIYFNDKVDLLNPQELKLVTECKKFIKDSKEEGRPHDFYHFREYIVDALE